MKTYNQNIKGTAPETVSGKKKKVKQPKTNRKAIDLANGERNKLNRAKRAKKHSEKNNGKENVVPHKNWKRRHGPSAMRRHARRLTKSAMSVAKALTGQGEPWWDNLEAIPSIGASAGAQ